MISEKRCAKALSFLATTDERVADLKTDVARQEYMLDLVKKRVFLTADGGVEERKAVAEVSTEVQVAVEVHLNAMVKYERMRAKRTTEALIVDTWRSVNANRRSGNL